jgi:hypothetical protein
MDKQLYTKPEFRSYGQISIMTQAVGNMGIMADSGGTPPSMDKTS